MKRLIFLLLICVLFYGCGVSKPPGLGTLYPVTITVTDKGQPLEGVLVSLANQELQTPRGCCALTNANGVAKIVTSIGTYTGDGAAAGSYRVVLSKSVPLPPELQVISGEMYLPEKEQNAHTVQRDAFLEKNRIIPKQFESKDSSPIALTVDGKNSATLTIDISKD
jgi:hypothetical protein